MQEEKVLLPELRFPEFEGEWVEKKLFEIAKIERGRFSPRPRNNPIYYNGEIPFVQTGDVVNSNGIIENYTQTLNQKGLKVSKLFPKGTILITIAANIGYAGVLAIDMACPDSLIGIKCKKNIFNIFLNYQLELEQPKMDYLAVAAAQKNINIEFLKPYKFIIADLKEQQKIANFLTAIDNRIQTLEKKETLLEQYKKGVMQKIFKQELRFKDDTSTTLTASDEKAFPEWVERMLGGLSKIKTGKLDANAMIQNGKYRFYTCAKYFYYINDYAFDTEALLVSGNGANVGYIHYFKGKFNAYQRTYILDSFEENIFYIKYYLKKFLAARIDREKKDGNTPYIVLSTLKDMLIKIPCLEEQTKIANFLSSIDKNIALVAKKIEHTKTYKKGLLQQMFV